MEAIVKELQAKLDSMFTLVKERDAQIAAQGKASEEIGKKMADADKAIAQLQADLAGEKAHRDELEKKFGRPGAAQADAFKSVGEQFVTSEEFAGMVKGRRFSSDRVAVKGLLNRDSYNLALKGLTSGALSAGALVDPMRVAEIIRAPERALRLRDLLTVAQTTSNAIEYPEETGFSNLYTVLTAPALAAATALVVESVAGFYPGQKIRVGTENRVVDTVVPATKTVNITVGLTSGKSAGDPVTSQFFTPTAEGAEKPQGNIAYELKSVPVKTIAHWIPASRQILADAGNLRSQIDGRLIYGLGLTEEEQILYGDGIGENMAGIMTNPRVQSLLWSLTPTGSTKIDAIRRGMALASAAEYPVDGIALNSADWCDIELTKGDDGHYIWLSVGQGAEARMFRVPIIETNALRSGEALVGAFALGATLYDREEATVRIAEQHADFFIKNMVVMLAEQREALAVFRPEAFTKVTFDSQP